MSSSNSAPSGDASGNPGSASDAGPRAVWTLDASGLTYRCVVTCPDSWDQRDAEALFAAVRKPGDLAGYLKGVGVHGQQ